MNTRRMMAVLVDEDNVDTIVFVTLKQNFKQGQHSCHILTPISATTTALNIKKAYPIYEEAKKQKEERYACDP